MVKVVAKLGYNVYRVARDAYLCTYSIDYKISNLWECLYEIAYRLGLDKADALEKIAVENQDPTLMWNAITEKLGVSVAYMSRGEFEEQYGDAVILKPLVTVLVTTDNDVIEKVKEVFDDMEVAEKDVREAAEATIKVLKEWWSEHYGDVGEPLMSSRVVENVMTRLKTSLVLYPENQLLPFDQLVLAFTIARLARSP